jgi:hypothetical protein
MKNPLLPALDRAIDLLSQCSYKLALAVRSAESDRFSFNPLSVFSGPLKYWRWHQAKKLYAEAARELTPVRAKISLPDADVAMPAMDILNDLFEYSDISPSGLAAARNPHRINPLRQMLGAELSVQNKFATAQLEVDHLLSEVGLVRAKLGSSATA